MQMNATKWCANLAIRIIRRMHVLHLKTNAPNVGIKLILQRCAKLRQQNLLKLTVTCLPMKCVGICEIRVWCGTANNEGNQEWIWFQEQNIEKSNSTLVWRQEQQMKHPPKQSCTIFERMNEINVCVAPNQPAGLFQLKRNSGRKIPNRDDGS